MFKLFIKMVTLVLAFGFVIGCGTYRKHFGGAQDDDHLKAKESQELEVPSHLKTQGDSGRNDIPQTFSEEVPSEKVMSDEPPGFN